MREMTKELKSNELNTAIDEIISGGELTPTGDANLDALVRLASGLTGLPSPDFRARLRAELVPEQGRRWWPCSGTEIGRAHV